MAGHDVTPVAFAGTVFDADSPPSFSPAINLAPRQIDLRQQAPAAPARLDPLAVFGYNDPLLSRQWHLVRRFVNSDLTSPLPSSTASVPGTTSTWPPCGSAASPGRAWWCASSTTASTTGTRTLPAHSYPTGHAPPATKP